MDRATIKRMLMVSESGCGVYKAEIAGALLTGQSYDKVLKLVPMGGAYDVRMWPDIANIHLMVAAWDPVNAYEWFSIAVEPLRLEGKSCGAAYWLGTTLGLVKTGCWFDQSWGEPTAFQANLPRLLNVIVLGSGGPENLEIDRYSATLTENLRAYFFPDKGIPGRSAQVKELLSLIAMSERKENLTGLGNLIIERLCHGILARRPAMQKVAAMLHILTTFRDRDDSPPIPPLFSGL